MHIALKTILICGALLSVQLCVSGQDKKTPPKRTVISGGVLNGKAISKPAPSYPPIAKEAKVSDTVTVQVLVDEDGKVVSAQPIKGHKLLHQTAVNAAFQVKFAPLVVSGERVKVSGTLTYDFVYKE